jgi:hypothetical protein
VLLHAAMHIAPGLLNAQGRWTLHAAGHLLIGHYRMLLWRASAQQAMLIPGYMQQCYMCGGLMLR